MAAYSSRRRRYGSRRAPEPEPEEPPAPARSPRRRSTLRRDRGREVHRLSAQKSRRMDAADKLKFLKPLGFGAGAVLVIVILLMIPGFVRRGRLNALSSADEYARLKAVVNLAGSGPAMVSELKARAGAKRAADAACLALGILADEQGGGRALEALVELATSKTPEVRRAAAAGLGRAGRVEGVETLKKLRGDDDPKVVLEAVRALGTVSGKAAVEALLSAVAADSEEERTAARLALARAVDGSSKKLLEEALASSHAAVREAARALLPAVAEGVSASKIEALLKSESTAARKAAMEVASSLGQDDMGGVVGKGLADEKAEVRIAALRTAAELDLRAFADKAVTLLEADAKEERIAACAYLESTYAMNAVAPLARVAANAEAPTEVRAAAFRALARLAPYLGDGKPTFEHPEQEARWALVDLLAPAFEKMPDALAPDAADALAVVTEWDVKGLPAEKIVEGLAKKRALAAKYGQARYLERRADELLAAGKRGDQKAMKEAWDLAVRTREIYKELLDAAEFREDKDLFRKLHLEMGRRTGASPPRPEAGSTRKETP